MILYGKGMHDFIMRELEVGNRVAHDEDDEGAGFGPFWDLHFAVYVGRKKLVVIGKVCEPEAYDAW